GEIEYLNIVKEKDGKYDEMKILSKGNSKIRYNGKLQIFNGKKLLKEIPMDSKVVACGNYYIARTKIDTKDVPFGEYSLRAVVFYDDLDGKLKTMKKETKINIQGEM
ncbi:MAG: hypothetical protein MJ231_05685, partial [bacterium]|nr:hypothetical protein [bacterium]